MDPDVFHIIKSKGNHFIETNTTFFVIYIPLPIKTVHVLTG